MEKDNKTEINESTKNVYKVIFIIGAPGAGKNTLCDQILTYFKNLKHFGAGDLLREEIKNIRYT